ncbi:MAG: HAD family hydrolase [Candidatus Micrarchaeia archaeon]|jgi:phosphoglycolate phosphatase-like HAD superfamily hydrolase
MGSKPGVLVLFDLDQTLVDAIPIYDKACRKVFAELFGVKCSAYDLDFAGKTLPAIIWEGCQRNGVSRKTYNAKLSIAISRLSSYFNDYLSDSKSKIRVLTGVKLLLEALSKKGIPMGIVTGSAECNAKRLLAKAGLSGHFLFVIGGERARDKRQGIALAKKDTKRLLGAKPARIIFVGDSPREAEIALDEGIEFIGTATGFHTKAQLSAAGAKKAFSNLSKTNALLNSILSTSKGPKRKRNA